MTKEELDSKMDRLGKLIYDREMAEENLRNERAEKFAEEEALREEIKAAILNEGESAESRRLKAVYKKASVKWDTKWLDGYSIDHPEIEKFRKVGKPTVAFILKDEWADDGR